MLEDLSDYNKINTDSRSIKEGDLFLALVGEKFDAHDFISKVIDSGAKKVFSQKEIPELDSEQRKKIELVPDTFKAYHQLATEYRLKVNPLVIAITGSVGKTTAKELLKVVLEQKFKVHATQGNFNNEYGVPKSILAMPIDTEILILEMGMRGLGEIELLSKTAKPNLCLITNCGTAHIEQLGSKENIIKAKSEIITGIHHNEKQEASLYVPEELKNKIENLEQRSQELNFKIISFNQTEQYKISTLSSKGLKQSIAAIELIAKDLGMQENQIQAGLNNYQVSQGRGNILKDRYHNIFIDESYNAIPEAIINSVDAMCNEYQEQEKTLVLGSIKESNQETLEELEKYLANKKDLNILKVSEEKLNETITEIKTLQLLTNQCLLIKGSRSSRLERIIEALDLK